MKHPAIGRRVMRELCSASLMLLALGVSASSQAAPQSSQAVLMLSQADSGSKTPDKPKAAAKPAASKSSSASSTTKNKSSNSKTVQKKKMSGSKTKSRASARTSSKPASGGKAAAVAATAVAGTAGAAPALFATGTATGPASLASDSSSLIGTPLPAMQMQVGTYHCELNRQVQVRSLGADRRSMVVAWRGNEHTLTAIDTASGALRFENEQAGLTWLVIIGKAMLLDSRKGEQLANECRL